MLMQPEIPSKLKRFRELQLLDRGEVMTHAQRAELHQLAQELVDLLETELSIEGIL